jgi:hypothetical protein
MGASDAGSLSSSERMANAAKSERGKRTVGKVKVAGGCTARVDRIFCLAVC